MRKIVFIGDSVTKGVRPGVVESDTFAQKIGAFRGFDSIINAGVSNNTSSNGLDRFTTDVLAYSPDSVSIMFGINDVATGVSVSIFEWNIRQMVMLAKAAGARITLMTPNFVPSTPYITAFPPYLDALRCVAVDEEVSLLDCYLLFEDAYFQLSRAQFDGLWGPLDPQHPSALGHQLIFDAACKAYNRGVCA